MLSCTNSASSQTMACAHEADGGPPPAPDDTDGNSLYRFVDTTGIRCLNERVSGSGKNCIKPFAQKAEADPFVESNEDDPELLLFVPFTEVVKLKSFALVGGDDDCSPSSVKFMVNRDDVDFTNAADLPAAQTVELISEHAAQLGADYPVKQHKFNNVTSLTIFVTDSFGGDSSRINFLGFKGTGTGIRHREVAEAVYESQAQLEDHKAPADEQGASNFLS